MPTEKAAMPTRPLSRIFSVSTKPMPSRPTRFAARHAAVLEDELGRVRRAHAELVLLLSRAEARRPPLDHEGGDALLARGAIGHRHDHRGVGDAAVGDEVLRAVQDPVAPVAAPRSCACRRRPSPSRARSGPSSPPSRRGRAAAGSGASAPRCPPGGCGPSRGCGARRGRAPRPRPRGPAPPSRSPSRAWRGPSRRTPPASSSRPARARPSFANTSRGNSCFSSHSRECGASSFSAKLAHRLAEQRLLLAQLEVHAVHGIPPPPCAASPRRRLRLALAAAAALAALAVWVWAGLPARSEVRALLPGRNPAKTRLMEQREEEARGEGAQGAGAADLGPALARLAPPHPRRALLGGPELLRARGRRLEGDPGVDREERGEGPLRARRQHDHPAARQEPLLRHAQDARPASCASWW